MNNNFRYVNYKLQTSCNHCGNPLMLNSPQESTHCSSCTKSVNIRPGIWKSLLEDLEDNYHKYSEGEGSTGTMMTGGFTFKYSAHKYRPHCMKCKVDMQADKVPTGETVEISCPQCGENMSSFPAPSWLKEELVTVGQVFGAEWGSGKEVSKMRDGFSVDSLSPGSESTEDAIAPIVIQCPPCSASLSISTNAEQVTPCDSCGSEIFIPDPVWRRLHPVKVVREWTLRYEGRTMREIKKDKKEKQRVEKERLKQEDMERRSVVFVAALKTALIPRLLTLLGGVGTIAYIVWVIIFNRAHIQSSWFNPILFGFIGAWVAGFLWGLVAVYKAITIMDKNFSPEWLLVFIPALLPIVGALLCAMTMIENRSSILFRGRRVSNPFSWHLLVGYVTFHLTIAAVISATVVADMSEKKQKEAEKKETEKPISMILHRKHHIPKHTPSQGAYTVLGKLPRL
jgi:DNA-directed RNA polymerase subunit M/transcription elongation factor TFIIS